MTMSPAGNLILDKESQILDRSLVRGDNRSGDVGLDIAPQTGYLGQHRGPQAVAIVPRNETRGFAQIERQ